MEYQPPTSETENVGWKKQNLFWWSEMMTKIGVQNPDDGTKRTGAELEWSLYRCTSRWCSGCREWTKKWTCANEDKDGRPKWGAGKRNPNEFVLVTSGRFNVWPATQATMCGRYASRWVVQHFERDAMAAAADKVQTLHIVDCWLVVWELNIQLLVKSSAGDWHLLTFVTGSDDLIPDWWTGEFEQHRRSVEIAVSIWSLCRNFGSASF